MHDIKPTKKFTPIDKELIGFYSSWPNAIPDFLICGESVESKRFRSHQIIDATVVTSLKNKKFLDFGCGEGFTLDIAKKYGAKTTVGYEIDEEYVKENVFSVVDAIKSNGPYDIILMYDVLDHTYDFLETMKIVRLFCHADTEIYVTTHPWISRHGGHEFHNDNKAFIHFFKEGCQVENLLDEGSYRKLFSRCGFHVDYCNVRKNTVETFFALPPFKERLESIADRFGISFALLIWKMRNSFYDFRLRVKKGSVTSQIPYPEENQIYPVAIVSHVIDEEESFRHVLFSNKRINDPLGNSEWSLAGVELTLKFPDMEAPDGYWVDSCILDIDMQRYSGINQLGGKITGELI